MAPYAILGFRQNASICDIRKAYMAMALQFHPDENKEPGAEEIFKEIAEAMKFCQTQKEAKF